MKTLKEQLGQRIYNIRRDRNETLAEMSKLIGVSPQSLNGYEKADAFPTYETLILICKLGNCTLDWLITGGNNIIPDGLTAEETELLTNFRKANKADQAALLKFSKSITD